jgi:hypothetical protein
MQPPAAPYPPPHPAYPPVQPHRRSNVAGLIGALVFAAVAGAGGYALGQATGGDTPVIMTQSLSPDAAQDKVCNVLGLRHEELDSAVDAFAAVAPFDWSNPEFLTVTDRLAAVTAGLADELQAALSPSTPPVLVLISDMNEYIAGLRATSASIRHRGPPKELNGVAMLYNQVRRPPLQACGIPW